MCIRDRPKDILYLFLAAEYHFCYSYDLPAIPESLHPHARSPTSHETGRNRFGTGCQPVLHTKVLYIINYHKVSYEVLYSTSKNIEWI